MSDDQPIFESKPLGETNPSEQSAKKPARKRAPRKPKGKPVESVEETAAENEPTIGVAPATTTASALKNISQKEIDDCLTTIYQDESGTLPNMQTIAIKKGSPIKKFLASLVVCAAIVTLSGWLYWFYSPTKHGATDSQVALRVAGPEHVALGATTTYDIVYENNQDVDLNNVRLNVQYPSGFMVISTSQPSENEGTNEWRLGTLAAHRRGTLTIIGKNFALPNAANSWRVFLYYSPTNFNSELEKNVNLTVTQDASPASVTITGPAEAATGMENEYTVSIKGLTDISYASLDIIPSFPDGFTITSSSPPLSKDGHWRINAPSPVASTTSSTPRLALPTFKLRGTWSDSASSSVLSASLNIIPVAKGPSYGIATALLPITISEGGLSLSIAINGALAAASTTPGGTLNTTIRLKNTTNQELKNITLKALFDAPSVKKQSVLKWNALTDAHDGDVQGSQISDDIRRGTITWNSKSVHDIASLKPNQEAVFDLEVPLKDAKEIDWSSVTTSTIAALSTATFTAGGNTQTISSDALNVTVNSDISFELRETKGASDADHPFTWIINNTLHPLKDIKITASVYGSAKVNHDTAPDSGVLSLDDTGKIITWVVTEMPSSLDVLTGPFVVSLPDPNPSQNTLMSKSRLEATDSVTGATIILEAPEVPLP